jgi:hypothetical protein
VRELGIISIVRLVGAYWYWSEQMIEFNHIPVHMQLVAKAAIKPGCAPVWAFKTRPGRAKRERRSYRLTCERLASSTMQEPQASSPPPKVVYKVNPYGALSDGAKRSKLSWYPPGNLQVYSRKGRIQQPSIIWTIPTSGFGFHTAENPTELHGSMLSLLSSQGLNSQCKLKYCEGPHANTSIAEARRKCKDSTDDSMCKHNRTRFSCRECGGNGACEQQMITPADGFMRALGVHSVISRMASETQPPAKRRRLEAGDGTGLLTEQDQVTGVDCYGNARQLQLQAGWAASAVAGGVGLGAGLKAAYEGTQSTGSAVGAGGGSSADMQQRLQTAMLGHSGAAGVSVSLTLAALMGCQARDLPASGLSGCGHAATVAANAYGGGAGISGGVGGLAGINPGVNGERVLRPAYAGGALAATGGALAAMATTVRASFNIQDPPGVRGTGGTLSGYGDGPDREFATSDAYSSLSGAAGGAAAGLRDGPSSQVDGNGAQGGGRMWQRRSGGGYGPVTEPVGAAAALPVGPMAAPVRHFAGIVEQRRLEQQQQQGLQPAAPAPPPASSSQLLASRIKLAADGSVRLAAGSTAQQRLGAQPRTAVPSPPPPPPASGTREGVKMMTAGGADAVMEAIHAAAATKQALLRMGDPGAGAGPGGGPANGGGARRGLGLGLSTAAAGSLAAGGRQQRYSQGAFSPALPLPSASQAVGTSASSVSVAGAAALGTVFEVVKDSAGLQAHCNDRHGRLQADPPAARAHAGVHAGVRAPVPVDAGAAPVPVPAGGQPAQGPSDCPAAKAEDWAGIDC